MKMKTVKKRVRKAVRHPERVYPFVRNWAIRRMMERQFLDELPRKFMTEIKGSPLDQHLSDISLDGRGVVPPWQGRNLYVLIRILKPRIAVETGVASGFSTAYILEALMRNRRGVLYSIDLPNESELKGREIGWAVPRELRNRWVLQVGDSRELLPQLFYRLRSIDFFMHDSKHTYNQMNFELQLAYEHLPPGGWLACHDAGRSSAFYDLAAELNRDVFLLGKKFGALEK